MAPAELLPVFPVFTAVLSLAENAEPLLMTVPEELPVLITVLPLLLLLLLEFMTVLPLFPRSLSLMTVSSAIDEFP
jgi:hypothetical protein